MARSASHRTLPSEHTTLQEITRRYYACAVQLARTMGLPLTETFLQAHRESISCCFIESGRSGVRLPERVRLPPLESAGNPAPTPEASSVSEELHEGTAEFSAPEAEPEREPLPSGEGQASVTSTNEQAPLPTRIPAEGDWPCAGHEISRLKPAQLHLLVARAGFRAHADVTVLPLLAALQIERGTRLERGRKRVDLEPEVE